MNNHKKFFAAAGKIDKLRILSMDIALKGVDSNGSPDNAGLCNLQEQLILVRNDQHPQQWLCTVLHEVVHVAEKAHQHEFTEPQVEAVALGIFSLLSENPGFRRLFDQPVIQGA